MTNQELIKLSESAREMAYAPYSDFRVGAALLCEDGSVFTGCNIENATYGATICAERCALSKAVSEGKRHFVKIAITSDSNNFTMPCGICRQVLHEFMPDGEVIVSKGDEIASYSIKELIPHCFEL